MTPEPTVAVHDRGGVREVTLHRPPVNALSAVEYATLEAAFAPDPAVRVRVLRGSGRTFCSGQDVEEARGLGADAGRYLTAAGAAIAAAARAPVPLVAVVNGPAVGAGALLVALADVVVCARDAWLAFPEARYGLPLGRSLLERAVPPRVARALLATGRRMDAERLLALGVADFVVDGDRLEEAAATAVEDLLALPESMAVWLFAGPEREARAAAYLAEVRATVAAGAWGF